MAKNSCNKKNRSDGLQPHYINIQFVKWVQICEVAIYLDYKSDESYTPKQIAIRCGYAHALKEMVAVDLHEPCGNVIHIHILILLGWVSIPLVPSNTRALQVQIVIQANHQNGRDTHVRQVRVYGFLSNATATNNNSSSGEQQEEISSLEQNVEYGMFAGIR